MYRESELYEVILHAEEQAVPTLVAFQLHVNLKYKMYIRWKPAPARLCKIYDAHSCWQHDGNILFFGNVSGTNVSVLECTEIKEHSTILNRLIHGMIHAHSQRYFKHFYCSQSGQQALKRKKWFAPSAG